MVQLAFIIAMTASVSSVYATALESVCTTSYARASLPSEDLYLADGTFIAITIDPSSITATPVTNGSASGSVMFPDATFEYCDVTFSYSHTGRSDKVNVRYWLPAPDSFKNRYLSTGGGGFAINSGTMSLPGGVQYGAVAGITDGGFGGFSNQFDTVWLLANGTGDWQSLYMFSYMAIHEMTLIGQAYTKQFFNMSDTKLYSYYQACSEGGREGWSQIQRFTSLDGAVTGAPAFRFAHQQVQHIYSNVVEKTLDYYPSPCEFSKIVNETIAFCDPLDGKTDGVVSRTDLCKLHFNINSTIGLPYYCAATAASGGGGGPPGRVRRQMGGATAATPAQNGTVSAQAVAVAQTILDGLRDSQGRQAYFSYQPAATFADAATAYNGETESWELSINGQGGEYITRFLQLINTTNLQTLDNVAYDTLVDWMYEGWQRYEDSLQTTWPDLTPFHLNGGKVLHYHGESDNSIPTASSVRYYESVREIMYPDQSYNDSITSLGEWYRLFLVPGAAHCSTNTLQPNGPFPQTNLAVLIDWVENGVVPTTLNATVLQGANKGQNQQICAWPLRPYWSNNGMTMECQYDQASINSWLYDLDAFKLPVY